MVVLTCRSSLVHTPSCLPPQELHLKHFRAIPGLSVVVQGCSALTALTSLILQPSPGMSTPIRALQPFVKMFEGVTSLQVRNRQALRGVVGHDGQGSPARQ